MEPFGAHVATGFAGSRGRSRSESYSEETRNLLKVLMAESKLTLLQKHHIQEHVNRGEPLPAPMRRRDAPVPTPDIPGLESGVGVRACSTRRRTQLEIARSGAYDRPQFYPHIPQLDLEAEKHRCRSMMSFGKVVPPTPKAVAQGIGKRPPPPRPPQVERDVFEELVDEVRDRADFLAEMRALGVEGKYRPAIAQEIAAKVRQMEAIDKKRCAEMEDLVGDFRHALPEVRHTVLQ